MFKIKQMIYKPSKIVLQFGFCCVSVANGSSLNREANFFLLFKPLSGFKQTFFELRCHFFITVDILVLKIFAEVGVQALS